MDSNVLRQMSLQNAQLALDQARFQAQYQIQSDKLWLEVQNRINGGIKEKQRGMLNIENIYKLCGKLFQVRRSIHKITEVKTNSNDYQIIIQNETSGGVYTLTLNRNPIMEVSKDKYYELKHSRTNDDVHIHAKHMKSPMELVKLIENFSNKNY